MILWNYPDRCPKCRGKEFTPNRQNVRIAKPEEIYFVCEDQSCHHVWSVKMISSKSHKFFFIHAKRISTHTPDGEVPGKCECRGVFAATPEDACKAVGIDGETGDYIHVDVFDFETLVGPVGEA